MPPSACSQSSSVKPPSKATSIRSARRPGSPRPARAVCGQPGHHPGGLRSAHGRGRLDLGAQRRAAAPPRPAGPRASRRPGGSCPRPTRSSAAAATTAGIPVTFQAEVHGVNAFCASKSAAGSASLRIAPTGSGGAARVGVSTTSYGASASRAIGGEPPHRADRQPELRAVDRAAALGQPAGERAQQVLAVSGGTTDSAVSTAQQVSNTGTASGGSGTTTSSTSWPSDSSSREASATGLQARGVDGGVGDDRVDEPGDPERARVAGRRPRGTTRTEVAPRTGRRPDDRRARRASPPRRARSGRSARPCARPIGSPYIG